MLCGRGRDVILKKLVAVLGSELKEQNRRDKKISNQ
jgi:hypothetical protein